MMGAGSGKPFPPSIGSVVVAPAAGDLSSVRRHPKFKDQLVPSAFPEVATLYDAFQRGLRVNPQGNCMVRARARTPPPLHPPRSHARARLRPTLLAGLPAHDGRGEERQEGVCRG